MRRLTIMALAILALLAGCRPRDTHSAPSATTSATAPVAHAAGTATSASTPPRAPAPPAASGSASPPAVVRACPRDRDCAVARIEVSGPHACCPACATTPGTRKWHAELQRWCAAHPPKECYPLACPMGPTRAVCRDGRCEATPNAADGGPGYVAVEQRCLPALVCDSWAGCALAIGNDQDGWFVAESKRVARGEIANPERVAVVGGKGADALRLYPPGVTCAPHSIPPIHAVPPRCATKAGHCVELP